ncbi:MAG: dihydroxyacetone kinase subunit L [Sedimentisphaerales bacterium]|nr:dihydroxyacetone kinase subunit L [Sedimentisphaerales bacterium]
MDTIGFEELKKMLLAAVDQIKANHELLSKLDSFGGDGDHGTTMVRAMGCLEKGVADTNTSRIKDLLNNVGWSIMGVDGGATGPLFGSLFMGMAIPTDGKDAVDTQLLAAMFESGLTGVGNVTKARVGDKTMIDALVPAVQELRAAAKRGDSVEQALAAAAEAAQKGAEATKALVARFGRAKNIGEKSKGQPDPGATSVSLVFRGLAQGVQSHGGS